MTRITYIENTTPVTIEIRHEPDLSLIGHDSIYLPETGQLALNSSDYETFQVNEKEPSIIRILKSQAVVVDRLYYELMTSGDISGAF